MSNIERPFGNPARTIEMPLERIDTKKVAENVARMTRDQAPIDFTTADQLRTQLDALVSRKQYHEELRDRYEGEREVLQKRLDATNRALGVAQEAVKRNPRLRHEISELEYKIKSATEEIALLTKHIDRQAAIATATEKLIKDFPHEKLKKLEAEEKELELPRDV